MLTRRRLLLVILLVAGAVIAWKGWSFLNGLENSGLPQREGEATLPALDAAVTIRFDAFGVPYLRADSVDDVARALGWVHANDRFAQMELNRRIATGRLSEVVGRAGLEMDRRMLTLQVSAIAEKALAAASAETLRLLEAYSAGVNAWLQQRGDDLQPLFYLTGLEPEPWTPLDSMCVPSLLAVSLSFVEKRAEEERYQILRELGGDALVDWVGEEVEVPAGLMEVPYVREAVAASAAGRARADDGGAREGGGFTAGDGGLRGSNNWVVGSNHSANGAPLIANDPHLQLRLPAIWYQVHLDAPGLRVAGMSVPGTPGVLLGHNDHLAWAFTNVMLDDNDLFFEQLDEKGTQVRRGDAWLPLRVQEVEIAVKDAAPQQLTLHTSDLGPLLPADPARGLPARSLAWAAHHIGDPLAPFLDLARATTLEEAVAAAGRFHSPAQNILIGHADGSIGWTLFGRQPQRKRGRGRIPVPGWDLEYGWNGLLGAEHNPRILRPAQDYLVSANAKVRGHDADLVCDYDTSFRDDRLHQLLHHTPLTDGVPPWTPESLAALQTDDLDLYADVLLRTLPASAEGVAGEALAALHAWDRRDRLSGMPALFWSFERALWQACFADELEHHRLETPSTFLQRPKLLRLLRGEMRHDWFDDVRTAEHEDREQILHTALTRAWQQVQDSYGSDPQDWRYGEDLHHLTLPHHLDAVPLLGSRFTRGPFPMPGSPTTVNGLGGVAKDWRQIVWGPSMRAVWVSGDWDHSRAVLPGGQSGHFQDPHYDDQIPLYLDGATRQVPWSDTAIEEATRSVLRLNSDSP